MKNPQRTANRQAANARQAQYVSETSLDTTTFGSEQPTSIRDPRRPKFLKWLRGKVGGNAQERAALKDKNRKVGAPYQRVQHRPAARSRR